MATSPAHATRIVTALFEGFPLEGSADTGLDVLNTKLETTNFGVPSTSRVLGFFEQRAAFDYIRQHNDLSTLVLIGHSLGGDSVIELADTLLRPAGASVDLRYRLTLWASAMRSCRQTSPAALIIFNVRPDFSSRKEPPSFEAPRTSMSNFSSMIRRSPIPQSTTTSGCITPSSRHP